MNSSSTILLVEDDTVDAMTVSRAAKELCMTNPIVRVNNGLEALDYLKNAEEQPCLILSDLRMPKMGGVELLEELKKHEETRSIPVVVLTTSKEQQDKLSSFNNGVAGYMLKPVDYLQFVEVVKAINCYWTLSEVPD